MCDGGSIGAVVVLGGSDGNRGESGGGIVVKGPDEKDGTVCVLL